MSQKAKKIFLTINCLLASLCHAQEKRTHSVTEKFVIGFASGAMTVTITEPLLFIKNKLQQRLRERIDLQQRSSNQQAQQLAKISFNPRIMYRGVLISALGFGPNMALQNGGFYIGTLYTPNERYKDIVAPIVAGCISSPASAIREMLTIQQQNHGDGYRNTLKRIGSQHGYHRLLRALPIIALRNSSFATFAFIATPRLSQELQKRTDNQTARFLLPGFIAGATSAFITHPLDTIKTNMQAKLDHKGGLSVAKELYYAVDPVTKTSGIRVLYAGLGARMLGVGLSMAIENNIRTRLNEWYSKKI